MKRQYPIIDARATGENIRRRRLEQGYTTRDVQEFLHLADRKAVYNWQAGRTMPNLDNFYALSLLLETTINALVAESPRPGEIHKEDTHHGT